MTKYSIEFDLKEYSRELFEILTKELNLTIFVHDTLNGSMTVLSKNYSEKILPFDRGDGTILYHASYNSNKLPVDNIIERLEEIDNELAFTIRKRVT